MPYSISKAKGVARISEITYKLNTMHNTIAGDSIIVTPSAQIVSDDIYDGLTGSGGEKKTNSQIFFNEQVELGKIVCNKVDAKADGTKQVDLIAGMSAKDARSHIDNVSDRNLLKDIIDSDPRKEIVKKAKERLKVVNPQGK